MKSYATRNQIKTSSSVAIIVIAFFTLSQAASGATIEQAKKFIKNNGACELAIGYVGKNNRSALYVNGALCITDP